MPRLVYLASARRDLLAILEFITRESGSLAIGRRFTEELRGQCAKLAALPGTLGRARPELRPDIRSFAFGSYVDGGDRFEIVNIIEGHRDIVAHYEDDRP